MCFEVLDATTNSLWCFKVLLFLHLDQSFWKEAETGDASSPEFMDTGTFLGLGPLLGQEGECPDGKPGPLKHLKLFCQN